jgi:hypothetical protein
VILKINKFLVQVRFYVKTLNLWAEIKAVTSNTNKNKMSRNSESHRHQLFDMSSPVQQGISADFEQNLDPLCLLRLLSKNGRSDHQI